VLHYCCFNHNQNGEYFNAFLRKKDGQFRHSENIILFIKGEIMHNLISIGSLSTTSYRYHQHSHRYWEITYYYNGNGVNIAGGVEYPFSDGTILCIPPHLLHEDRSEDGYCNIFFMVESFNFHSATPIVAHDNADKDFLYILKQLFKEYYCDKPSKKNILNALLNTLYEYLMNLFGSKSSNVYINTVQRALVENLSNPYFTLQNALADVPINPDYFRRQFKAYVGMSPGEYQQSLRISQAKQMLVTSTFPLKDICLLCGYEDPYYFSRIFKKVTGLSPREYRKQNTKYN